MNDDRDDRLGRFPRRDRPIEDPSPLLWIDLDAVPPLTDVTITVSEDSASSWDQLEGGSR